MIDTAKFQISDYIKSSFDCTCGVNHSCSVRRIDISSGALNSLAEYVRSDGFTNVLVVCDRNTYAAAGEKTVFLLLAADIVLDTLVFENDILIPDEYAVGSVVMAASDCQLIIGVGSGTVNDICRMASFKMKLPYYIVATAPSMDGYASSVAAMTVGGMKKTLSAHAPQVIIGDTGILQKAPMPMIAAGLGDILGKYTCLCDWKLSGIINGEYYCNTIVQMMREAIRRVAENIGSVKDRRAEGIGELMSALVLSGVAMSFAGSSRPASGSEHHLSHFWEMRFHQEGITPQLHGTKVGIGTITVLRFCSELLEIEKCPDFATASVFAATFDKRRWEKEIVRVYGKTAGDVLTLDRLSDKNTFEGHGRRIATIQRNWNEIVDVMTCQLPSVTIIESMLTELGAPCRPFSIGITPTMLTDSLIYAKELRDRYTVLQLAWDMGVLDTLAKRTLNCFVNEQKSLTIQKTDKENSYGLRKRIFKDARAVEG